MSGRWFRPAGATCLALILLCSASPSKGATIHFYSVDSGTGFDDPTPTARVGANIGATLGIQRLNAFYQAALTWENLLAGPVDIRVQISFKHLDCTADDGNLGQAGVVQGVMDFPNATLAGTWFPVALAKNIAGTDLFPGVPDIVVEFNSDIGTPGCLENLHWYYGLDGHNGEQVDLVSLALHELAHGLGFYTFVDANGAELDGSPDVYERHVFDTSLGKHWNDMSDDERRASAVNAGHLTWDGEFVRLAVPSTLEPAPLLTVAAPADVAGDFLVGTSTFGAPLTFTGVSARVVQAVDAPDAAGPSSTDGCSDLANQSDVAGQIALIDRGTCSFVTKALHAQEAGAVGVAIVDNVVELPIEPAGQDPSVTIPVVGLSQADGNAIKAELSSGVTATLRIDPDRRAGADSSNRMLLFAPNPAVFGASVSHWDQSALPNLLMEPVYSTDLSYSVDLTLPLLFDIGWTAPLIAEPGPRDPVTKIDSERQTRIAVRP